jgi:hypothetical protein
MTHEETPTTENKEGHNGAFPSKLSRRYMEVASDHQYKSRKLSIWKVSLKDKTSLNVASQQNIAFLQHADEEIQTALPFQAVAPIISDSQQYFHRNAVY